MSVVSIILIGIGILLFWAVSNYGKNTVLGAWGSLVLAILMTPIPAYFIIMIFLSPKKARLKKIFLLPKKQCH